ncbi:MAG: kynureninase [Pseudomonadota bacterium]
MSDFAATKAQFHLPENLIYLDGNSLGPLPKAVADRVGRTLHDEWGEMVIRGWNRAGWMQQPRQLGDRVGSLIGAADGTVVIGDTLSIKVFQAVSAALNLAPKRKIVLSDTGNFPTDLYMADGLLKALGGERELKLVEPEVVIDALDDTVAVVMLTHVDYRTGRTHDMEAITRKAHDHGVIVVWDLAHSAGAVEVDVTTCKADFAIGCTYKYLNGGPGAPAFIYMRPDHASATSPILAGWLGHEAPFAFDLDYKPGDGIDRFRVGTPPVLQMAALEAAMDIWDQVSMADVRKRSLELTDLFIQEIEARCPMLELASPRDSQMRGSQVSFRFENGYAAMQAIIEQGVIGDFRAPDIMRFGFTPLYINRDDVLAAVDVIASVMTSKSWDRPRFHERLAVT